MSESAKPTLDIPVWVCYIVMPKLYNAAILAIYIVLIAGCNSKEVDMNKSLIAAPTSELPEQLRSSEIPDRYHEFILSQSLGNYPYISITLLDEKGALELTIDEFLYDEWVNPTKGTSGRSPHGTATIYRWESGEWISTKSIHYSG